MQWSKLKSRIKTFICPELNDRIDFHLTSYRRSHDGADKVWISIDRKKIYSFDHYVFERAESSAFHAGLSAAEVKESLESDEIYSPKDFGTAMRAYLDLPIGEALRSPNPIIKAFALIDGRTGRRTIEDMHVADSENPLVRAFYQLRKSSLK